MLKKLGIGLAAIIILAIAVSGHGNAPKPIAFALFKIANHYFNDAEYETAESLYIKAVEIDDKFSRAYHNLGVIAYQDKKLDDAKRWFTKSIECDSSNAKAAYSMGILMFEGKQYESAAGFFRNATLLQPENENAHFDLAVSLVETYRQANPDNRLLMEAISEFEQAKNIEHSIENIEVLKNLV
jgi:tetratricopeptide (TPR) repeat protein